MNRSNVSTEDIRVGERWFRVGVWLDEDAVQHGQQVFGDDAQRSPLPALIVKSALQIEVEELAR